jgi:hypothetical protein
MAIHPSQNSTLLKGSSKNSGWMASVALDTAMALGVSHWLWEWTAISMSSHGEEMALDGQRVAPHQAQLRDARAGSWSQTHHGWQFHRGYWR